MLILIYDTRFCSTLFYVSCGCGCGADSNSDVALPGNLTMSSCAGRASLSSSGRALGRARGTPASTPLTLSLSSPKLFLKPARAGCWPSHSNLHPRDHPVRTQGQPATPAAGRPSRCPRPTGVPNARLSNATALTQPSSSCPHLRYCGDWQSSQALGARLISSQYLSPGCFLPATPLERS